MENKEEQIVAQSPTRTLKHFILGKLWLQNVAGNRPGAIRISRNLPASIVLEAGTTLFLNQNKKRADKQDADFNVSILLPAETADKLIQSQKMAA